MSGAFDNCLKCTICHTQCPVARACPDFPGPKRIGPEEERLMVKEAKSRRGAPHLASCTGCRRCDDACPHGVRPSWYAMRHRPSVPTGGLAALRNWILAHNGWWGALATVTPGLSNAALALAPMKAAMGLIGIANRDFPKYARRPIRRKAKKGEPVVYFPGCYASFNAPEIVQAAVDILEASGYAVELFPSLCCTTPMFTNALMEEAATLARRNVSELASYVDRGFRIVTTCSSCGLALRSEYGDLIPGEDTTRVAAHTWDLFELLEADGKAAFKARGEKLARAYYHVSCHMKALGIGVPAAGPLREFAVSDLSVSDEFCCGLAGTFGFKKEKSALAMAVGKPLFDAVRSSGASLAVTDCGTCALQIDLGASVEVKHPAVVMRGYL